MLVYHKYQLFGDHPSDGMKFLLW